MDQGPSHTPISQPSSGKGESTCKPSAGGSSPSGKGLLKRKLPLWLKRKGPANSSQGLVVSRSRLCVEATQESPIQAVRKAAPQRAVLGLNSEEDSTRGKTGTSLLRKLWCLKATDSRLKKRPLGLETPPSQRASWGPVAALSRTADPQGESPLRWKPRVEMQNPEEVSSFAKPEKAERASQPGASWFSKPWRTFRSIMTTRAKKASVFSGNQKNPGSTGERVICLAAESETSPATKANEPTKAKQNNPVAVEDKTPPSTPPSVMDELYEAREDEGGDRTPQRRLESHRAFPKLPVRKENGCRDEGLIFEVVSEPEGIEARVCSLLGGIRLEAGGAGTEDKAPTQGDNGFWPDVSDGEDLAELAENPGGQGMVMATRGLGWLNSEGLGGPKMNGKAAISTQRNPTTQGTKEAADGPRESKWSHGQAPGVSAGKTSTATSLFLTALSENGKNSAVTGLHSGTSTTEEVAASYATFSQETRLPALPGLCPSRSPRVLESGAEGSPTPPPLQTPSPDPPGGNRPYPGSPAEQWMPSATKPHGALGGLDITGPEEAQKRRLIYMAAVEIVEAAIDAAAEQLAKKREPEETGHWGQAEERAGSSAGAAMQQRGWLA